MTGRALGLVTQGPESPACTTAANATLHSWSGRPDGHFTVSARVDATRLRVEVRDQGGPWTRPVRRDGHGHGLGIVAALARQWGREGDITGWTVWFEMDLP